ncbi:MAG: extracellular solute-binding protein [Clostridia bacterium]|nr:extracellular solute-binding protein [Clostridia bacterium]
MTKKFMSLCLAVTMLAGCLWGCSAPSGTAGGGAGKQQTESKRQEETQQEGPKGRYAESSISIPLEEGERAADIIQTEDQVLELYTVKDKKASRYIWTGENWEKQDNSLLEGLEFPYGTLHMIYGEDQNRYVLYQGGDDFKTFMMKLTEGQEPQMLLDQVFSAKNNREYYDVRPDFAAVSEDGLIFLSHSRVTDVYTPDGSLVLSLPQKWSSMDWKGSGLLMGDSYITNSDSSYLSYDISGMSASTKEEIPFQSPDFDMWAPMASDGSGGIYIANPQGIHHMNQGGSMWETVADGTLNSLSLPSANIRKLFVGSQNDFYVWMTQDEKDELKHYTYDPQMPSVPTQTLTVYGLDLGETDTIRQAASMFQLEHPDVRVELIDGQTGAGSTTVSDTIRALNTELLGGNGADLLILDGLPAESYIEKGILTDLKEYLSPMIESGELMEQVTKPYTEENGGIYQVPTRMMLLAAYGDSQAVASLVSMEAMRDYQMDASHLPLRPKTNYESLLRQILMLKYDEIVDTGTGQPYGDKIKELLETVKVLGEANGAEPVFDESEDGGQGNVYNLMPGQDGLLGSEYNRVDRGLSAIAIDKIGGMYDVLLPLAVQRKHGFTMENADASYLPAGTMGINQACQNKEMAREFMLFVLGRDVQSKDLSDGLPVNILAAGDWVERENTSGTSIAVSGDDGYELAGSWPTKEERQLVFDIAARATHPIRMDRVLTDIIINETKGYFEGSLSLEQAAQNAQNKAMLYFSE